MEAFTSWLGEHQYWILLTTALLAFFESLALVGIVIPGVALLFAAAAAAGSASISLTWLLAAGFTGAVLGDGLSYFLGRYFHARITQLPPFDKHPEWITKGEQFFERYGVLGIVIGRFIGPIRPVMPLVAGMLEMPAHRFLSINVLSAFAWAPFYLLPGYFVGAATENHYALQTNHILLFIGLIGLPWLISIFTGRVKATTVLILGGTLFCITYLVTSAGLFNSINETVLHTFITMRMTFLDYLFVAITTIGYWLPMVIWASAIAITLLLQRHIAHFIIWCGATLLGQVSIFGLKDSIGWPRPNVINIPPNSFAFPSGHTAITIVFLGTLLILTAPRLSPQRRRHIVLGSAAAWALVATSRLYLNVHWLSDILAGTGLGLMIVCLAHLVATHPKVSPYMQRSPSFRSLALATVAGLTLACLLVIGPTFQQQFAKYQLQETYLPHE